LASTRKRENPAKRREKKEKKGKQHGVVVGGEAAELSRRVAREKR